MYSVSKSRDTRITAITWASKPLAASLLAVLAAAGHQHVMAATMSVANCNDAGSGSLRDAVARAQSSDTIDLSALTCSQISLTSGSISIAQSDLNLHGPGRDKLAIDLTPTALLQQIRHSGTGKLHIDSLSITRHQGPSWGVTNCVDSAGSLELVDSVVTGCHGAGVHSTRGLRIQGSTISNGYSGASNDDGPVSITGSTISGNNLYGTCVGLSLGTLGRTTASAKISNTTISGNKTWDYFGSPGGVAGCINQPVTITNSTVAFNSVRYPPWTASVGGLAISSTQVVIDSSIIARNDTSDLQLSAGTVVSGHNNLIISTVAQLPVDTITSDPKLLPLADNGGPTQTHALAPDSLAIDAGNNNANLPTDQRGYPRVVGVRADIGAYEFQSTTTTVTIGPGFSGAWYDPNQSGQGLLVEVLNGGILVAFWFSFTPDGQQAWFGGAGTYSGNTATIPKVEQPMGGRWIPNFDPTKVVRQPWGSMTLSFSDCNHGRVDFNSALGYGAGHMDLTRLTMPAGLSCQ